MQVSTLLADPEVLCLETFISEQSLIVIRVRVVQEQSKCPLCLTDSQSLHGHYIRRIADLPWHGLAGRLELHTRKLRCHNQDCCRKVFCQRLPKVVQSYARKTVRLTSALTLLAFALCGEAGARAASGLNIDVCGATLLQLIRRHKAMPDSTIRVLGVDDFAFRRGCSYGTILVDLERHRPIDLLVDRESGTLAKWLTAHHEVEIISRDRSKAYAEAANVGAPKAVQIADRWHLLKNLGEHLERLLLRHHSVWRRKLNEPLLSAINLNQLQVPVTNSISLAKESPPNELRPEVAARHQARSEVYK